MNARFLRLAMVLGAVLSGTGCYRYIPISGAPRPGTDVALVLNDQGRVALGARVGTEMDQLRGQVVASAPSSVTLSMRETVTLRGVMAKWTAESLTVNRDQLAYVRERQLARGRTALMAGAVGAAVITFIVTRNFLDDSRQVDTDPSNPPGGPGPSTTRIPVIRLRSN